MEMNSVDSTESDKSLKHEYGEFKDSLCNLCLSGVVLSSLALTQEEVGSNFTKIFCKPCRFCKIKWGRTRLCFKH